MFPAAFAASINSTLSLKKNEFQQNRHDFPGCCAKSKMTIGVYLKRGPKIQYSTAANRIYIDKSKAFEAELPLTHHKRVGRCAE